MVRGVPRGGSPQRGFYGGPAPLSPSDELDVTGERLAVDLGRSPGGWGGALAGAPTRSPPLVLLAGAPARRLGDFLFFSSRAVLGEGVLGFVGKRGLTPCFGSGWTSWLSKDLWEGG